MAKLSEFIAEIKQNGVAMEKYFFIELGIPPKARGIIVDGVARRRVHLMCRSVRFSGVNVATAPRRIVGEVFEYPYDRNFSNVELQFYNDKDFMVRELFEEWVRIIQNPNTREFSYYDEYTTDMKLHVIDKNERQYYTVEFYEVFPKTLDGMTLDHASNQPMVFGVSMSARYYKTKTLEVSPSFEGSVNLNEMIPGNIDLGKKFSQNIGQWQRVFEDLQNASTPKLYNETPYELLASKLFTL